MRTKESDKETSRQKLIRINKEKKKKKKKRKKSDNATENQHIVDWICVLRVPKSECDIRVS